MNETVATNAFGMQGPLREKLWDERDTAEKLNALRAEVINLSRSVQMLRDIGEKMLRHSHDESGLPCVRFEQTFGPYHDRIPMSLRERE